MEAFYRQVHELEGNVPQFPQHYPRGALLGCVWVRRLPAGAGIKFPFHTMHVDF